MVGVLEEAGEYLHHARVEPFLVADSVSHSATSGSRATAGVRRHDAPLLLPLEHPLPVDIPTLVELSLVLVGPLPGHLMRRVHRARTEVEKEGFVGRYLLGIGDELDGAIHQIDGEVIALLQGLGRQDGMVVVDQVGEVLVRVTAHKSVVAFEAAAERPAIERPRRAGLLTRRQVPLAERERVVAVRQKHLREESVLERDETVRTRITC